MERKRMKSQQGFTLLELLMVVIIIAILASIALPQYLRATERARAGQVIQLLGSIRGSEMRFKAASPAGSYDNSAGLLSIDIAPLPTLPTGWTSPPTVTSAVAGADARIIRAGGAVTVSGKYLNIDLDTGNFCAETVAAATDWGVPPPSVAAPICP